MPLAFASKSHGTIAFGFFNIETDMLLLENLFFFADRFCRAVVTLAEQSELTKPSAWMDGFRIDNQTMIGNLHGAIQGWNFRGFIGETYRRFPFPSHPEGFKQKPSGEQNRAVIQELIEKFAKDRTIQLSWDKPSSTVSIEEFIFDEAIFGALIAYVDRGGYPRWQDEIRPPYVNTMMDRLAAISSPFPRR